MDKKEWMKEYHQRIKMERPKTELYRTYGFRHQLEITLNRELREIFKEAGITDLDKITSLKNPEKRKCVICLKEFMPKTGRQKTCSKECHYNNQQSLTLLKYYELRGDKD